jgi:hypothetical protein
MIVTLNALHSPVLAACHITSVNMGCLARGLAALVALEGLDLSGMNCDAECGESADLHQAIGWEVLGARCWAIWWRAGPGCARWRSMVCVPVHIVNTADLLTIDRLRPFG